ncbi:hypothetical protein ACFRSX_32515 [Streptomyces goshikiensis]|uniref:hypothetical protein n=1 Tax=Streptomyces TaxID=1883 RepID=UPI000C27520C|nr:hypothetical protein [Streptomyces sp. CB02120-2]PJN14511.1 hypothetical protein CG724_32980 [Streptomyces sp. CB02120-2]
MHTALQDCQDALEAAQDQAQGLARTLAATLAHMYPHAAYLVLRRDPRSGELHLDSLRTAGGAQGVCGDLDTLPELTDPELRTAWGGTDPRDPQALLQVLGDLDRLGAPFGRLPDSAQVYADPYEDTAALLCLVVNADAPEPEGHDREVTARLALTVSEEATYEFTVEVRLPAYIVNNPNALHDYLADNEDLWLDDLDPLSGVTINERSLDGVELTLAA